MKPGLTKKILKYALIVSVAIAILVALVWLILQGYAYPWTGFGEFTKSDSNFVPRKTLWDWLQLLVIPIFLSAGLYFLNHAERDNEREIAVNHQRESVLQSYLDRMADLLLEKKLQTTDDKSVKDVARIQTLTVLQVLDVGRKKSVLFFLREAGLINNKEPIVILRKANLRDTDLSIFDWRNINLENAFLTCADLSGTSLDGAVLMTAIMEDASLKGASLKDADLNSAYLSRANLSRAKLQNAILCCADLSHANLTGANLTGANLAGANLTEANLNKAKISVEQLKSVGSLERAIMPDGTKHK